MVTCVGAYNFRNQQESETSQHHNEGLDKKLSQNSPRRRLNRDE